MPQFDDWGGIAVEEKPQTDDWGGVAVGSAKTDDWGGIAVDAEPRRDAPQATIGPSLGQPIVGSQEIPVAPSPSPTDMTGERMPDYQISETPITVADWQEGLMTPMANIVPHVTPETAGKIMDVAGGVINPLANLLPKEARDRTAAIGMNAAGETVNFFTSPLGIGTAGLGLAPAVVQRAAALAFGTEAALHAPETYAGIRDAKTPEEFDAAVTGAILSSAVLLGGLKHGLGEARMTPAERKAFVDSREIILKAPDAKLEALAKPDSDATPEARQIAQDELMRRYSEQQTPATTAATDATAPVMPSGSAVTPSPIVVEAELAGARKTAEAVASTEPVSPTELSSASASTPRNSELLKGADNSELRDTNISGDLPETFPALVEGSGNINTPLSPAMKTGVTGGVHDLKVLDPVVPLPSVDVMNNLVSREGASDVLFNDKPVSESSVALANVGLSDSVGKQSSATHTAKSGIVTGEGGTAVGAGIHIGDNKGIQQKAKVNPESAPAPAQQPSAAGADLPSTGKPVEQMTPQERKQQQKDDALSRNKAATKEAGDLLEQIKANPPAGITVNKDGSISHPKNFEPPAIVKQLANAEQRAKLATTDYHGAGNFHRSEVRAAVKSGKPVSAVAVEAYGIKLPEGWTKQGELYVPPATTTPAPKPSAQAQTAPPAPATGETIAPQPAAPTPKLREGQKQGDLLGGSEDLTLVGERVKSEPAKPKGPEPTVQETVSEAVRVYGKVEDAYAHLQTQIDALKSDPLQKATVTRLRAAQRVIERQLEDQDRLERMAEHEREMGDGHYELVSSIEQLGKLPAQNTAEGIASAGEIGRILESTKTPKANRMNLTSKQAKSLDTLREALNERGFDFTTYNEMLEAYETALRNPDKKQYGTTSRPPDYTLGAARKDNPIDFPPQKTTGLKKATVKDERIQQGLDDLPPEARQPEEARVQRAEDRVDNDATLAPSLVSRIVDSGEKAISPDDAAVLLVERTRLMNERREMERKWYDPESTREAKAVAEARLTEIEALMERLDQAQRAAGSSWGRVGHLYQRMMREDFTLEAMERRMRKAKEAPLTQGERAKIKEQSEKIADLETKVAAGKAMEAEFSVQAERTRALEATIADFEKVEAARPKWPKEVFEVARGVVERWKQEAESIGDLDIREFLGSESGAVGGVGGPKGEGKKMGAKQAEAVAKRAFITKVAIKMRAVIGEHGLNFAETSAHMIARYTEKIQPYLQKAWVEAQQMIGAEKSPPKVKAAIKEGAKPATDSKTPAKVKARAKAEATAGMELTHQTAYEAVRAQIEAGVKGEQPIMEGALKTLKEAYPDLTARELDVAFSEYGKVKFPSKEATKVELAKLRTLRQMQAKIDDLKARGEALHSGLQRDKMDADVRKRQAELTEALKKYAKEKPSSPERLASIEEGRIRAARNAIEDLDRELKTGEARIKSEPKMPGVELEQLRAELDAMRELKKELEAAKNPPLSEAQKALDSAMIARERAWQTLDDLSTGKVKEPAKIKEALTQLEEDVRMETDAMKQLAAEMRRDAKKPGDPGYQKDQAQIRALEKAIERYAEKTSKGEFTKAGKLLGPDSRRVAQLKEIRNSRREAYRAIVSPEQRYNAAQMERIAKQTAEAEARIKAGDFTPRAKKVQPAKTKETEKAAYELHKLKQTIKQGEFEWGLERRTKREKARDATKEAFHTIRAIMTGGELSGLLRQGKFSVASHPFLVAKGPVPAMLKALRSEAAEHLEMTKITERPNAPEYRQAGLAIHDPFNFTEAQLEGNYRSRTANKIPIIAASGRAYTVFLNRLRADVYDALKANFESVEGRSMTPTEMKNVANFINEQTGSGSLGLHGQKAVGFLNAVYFAPKFTISRFQMLFGHSLWEKNSTWATRKLIAKEYARIGAGLAVMYALYQLGLGDEPIETDLRSSRSGTIRSGKSSIDPMAGELQAARLVARAWTGESMVDGEIRPLVRSDEDRLAFGVRNMKDVLFDFNRSKMSPIAGAAMDEILREDFQGEALGWKNRISRLTPITYQQIYNTMTEEENVPKAAALSVLGFLGEGVRTETERQ